MGTEWLSVEVEEEEEEWAGANEDIVPATLEIVEGRLLKLSLEVEEESDTQPPSSQVGVTKGFGGQTGGGHCLLLWFVKAVVVVILVAGVVEAVVSKRDEEVEDTVEVEQDMRSLKLFVLRDMPLAPSIVLPPVDRQSAFTFSSPLLSQLDTSLLRGCSRKNPDEAPEDSAFLFEDLNEVEGSDVTTVKVIFSPKYSCGVALYVCACECV